jgi:hypothetical protein
MEIVKCSGVHSFYRRSALSCTLSFHVSKNVESRLWYCLKHSPSALSTGALYIIPVVYYSVNSHIELPLSNDIIQDMIFFMVMISRYSWNLSNLWPTCACAQYEYGCSESCWFVSTKTKAWMSYVCLKSKTSQWVSIKFSIGASTL